MSRHRAEEYSSEHPPEEGHERRYRLFLCGAIACFAAAVTMTPSNESDAGTSLSTCVVPAEADFTSVDVLIERPRANDYTVWDSNAQDAYNAELAKSLHLDLYPFLGDRWPLFESDPFSDHLRAANGYLENFGVTMGVSKSKDHLKLNAGNTGETLESEVTPLTGNDLESVRTKMEIATVMEEMSYLPRELIELSGLKHIELVKIEQTFHGYADSSEGTIYIDPTIETFGRTVLKHELYHLIDAQHCFDISNDPAFSALGPADQYTDPEIHPLLTDIKDAEVEALRAEVHDNWEEMRDRLRAANKLIPGVVSVREYGQMNIKEDKATIGEELLDNTVYSSVDEMKDPQFAILGAKYRLLLARLHAADPAIATYISRRH